MISGTLFLAPEKELTLKALFRKYLRKIVLALVLFGTFFAIMELVIVTGMFSVSFIPLGFLNMLCGNSWAHMWYLYMLICLYMLTPLLRSFTANSSKKSIECTLVVLFTISILFPSLKTYGIQLESWMILGTPFIFYYILGYYLAHVETLRLKTWHCIVMCILYTLIIAALETKGLAFSQSILLYHDITTVLGAISVFLLFKRMKPNWGIASNLRCYCFPIYLVHTVFTNASYKFLGLFPSSIASPWIAIPFFTISIFLLSLALSYVLRKIRPLREYVI
jgi:surface polysaccharide O-acyltransferase-like enzyme